MTGRLVVLILFFIAAFSLLSINGYKKYFSPSHSLNLKQIRAERAKVKADEEARIAAEKAKAEALKNPGKIVLSEAALKGKELYASETAQCLRCHGENGAGNASEEAPLIAGQHEWYITDQLAQMKSGARANEKMMPYLKALSEKDFSNLAAYITTLRVQ